MEEDYNLLVIDDDKSTHIILGKLLENEYNVIRAYSALEGIDKLSEEIVHFILTDIHMPGMSGLEFLESLMVDADRKNIPVLIMTSMPSVEKEKKALGLGAVDFIDKTIFNSDPDELRHRISTKMVSNVEIPDLPEQLVLDKKEITKKIMFELSSGDFFGATQALCKTLAQKLQTDHLSFWTINGDSVQMLMVIGEQLPRRYGPKELKEEKTFQYILKDKKPYLVNNVFHSEKGILPEMSKEEKLPAEIGVPLFALTEKQLIKNKMKIPPKTPLFGYVVMKRNKVFTSKEFKMTSVLMMHMGTILYRLYSNM